MNGFVFPAAIAFSVALAAPASAAVIFSNATASFHQTFDRNWDAPEMIDGVLNGSNGWAIFNPGSGTSSASTIFTLATPLAAGTYSFTFTIHQGYERQHNLGNFSLGYTTAAAPTLASASVAVALTSASSVAGATFGFPSTGELVVGGTNGATDIYTIFGTITSGAAITGFFLNAIDNPTNGLPTGGPGRQPSNGNFVVSEFIVDVGAIPEPATWGMMLLGFGLVGSARRRRRLVSAIA